MEELSGDLLGRPQRAAIGSDGTAVNNNRHAAAAEAFKLQTFSARLCGQRLSY